MTHPILALVGPTASGKTSIAVTLAERFGAEIVCADSMTVYRSMDIGTAKPGPAERARVPHHLLDVADPSEPFTVARYQRKARAAIADIRARGAIPFVVGGSGLYFRAAVDDLSFPPTDPAVRARLDAEDATVLTTRLERTDPDAAAFVDPANRRRVVRALEVMEITGRPFSSFRDSWGRYTPALVAGLAPSLPELDRRIDARLHTMVANGLLDEVRTLIASGAHDALTSSRAIPYRQAVALIEGTITQDDFFEQAARATRRLARRQLSWFRRDPRIRWFTDDQTERAEAEVGAYYSETIEQG